MESTEDTVEGNTPLDQIVPPRRSGRARRPPNRPLDSKFQAYLTDTTSAARAHMLSAPLDSDLVHMLTTMEHLPALFAAATTVSGRGFEPATWKEAMSCPEQGKWRVAAHTEFQNHVRNGTWRRLKLATVASHTYRRRICLLTALLSRCQLLHSVASSSLQV
ncbi:hypothetical protein N7486_003271 [Penicillium sp. IBT 16267x]|nr:hypothetical protein N7486_003271 [Penicillium sp. IBT 16267x]